jgi:hypothetical protein
MKTTRDPQERVPHLVVVASRDHLDPDISCWADWAAQEGILRHFSNRENWPKDQVDPNYANSKLMLMYLIEQYARKRCRKMESEAPPKSVLPHRLGTDSILNQGRRDRKQRLLRSRVH